MGRVVIVGSLNADLVTHVDNHPSPGETVLGRGLERFAGGKGGNQAVACAAAGADTWMIACVGDDPDGQAYLKRLRDRGIDISACRITDEESTGQAWITVDDDGENTIVVVPGANSSFTTGDVELVRALGPGDVLLMQLEIPVGAVEWCAREAADAGARVILNMAPFRPVAQDVVALADPVIVNEHEAKLLADSGLVPQSLLVTFGANGVSWDGQFHPAAPVHARDVVDTTGAGDAFCGALAAALASGADRQSALGAATTAGAEAVKAAGAQPGPRLR